MAAAIVDIRAVDVILRVAVCAAIQRRDARAVAKRGGRIEIRREATHATAICTQAGDAIVARIRIVANDLLARAIVGRRSGIVVGCGRLSAARYVARSVIEDSDRSIVGRSGVGAAGYGDLAEALR